jgi:hypothetical protein
LLIITEPEDDTTVSGSNNLIRRQINYHEITVSTDAPLLAALANNGGSTLTHAPAGTSPTVNAGTNPLNLTTDQRGPTFARVVGGQPDIGAFELQTVVGPDLPGDYNDNETVDAADYVIWRKTYGTSVPMFSGADGSGNGMIDNPDYSVWQANFGTANPGSASASLSPTAVDGALAMENSPVHNIIFDSLAFSRSAGSTAPMNRRNVVDTLTHPRTSAQGDARDHEAALLAVLAERSGNHPSLVSVHEVGSNSNSAYIGDFGAKLGSFSAGGLKNGLPNGSFTMQ